MAGGIGAQSFTVAPESTGAIVTSTPSVTTFAAFGTGRPLWPSDIPGLVLWLPADQIQGIASGASLSNWTDSSASAAHATQASGVSQPAFVINVKNGLSAVSFGVGVAQLMTSSTSVFDATTYCVVMAPSRVTTASQRAIGGTGAASNTRLLMLNVSGVGTWQIAGGGGPAVGNVAAVQDGWVSMIGFNGAGSGATLIVNSVASFNVSTATSGTTTTTLNIAAQQPSAQTCPGYYGEICVYNRNLTTIEWSSLDSYFRTKWAI